MKAQRYITGFLLLLTLVACVRYEPIKAVYLELQDPLIRQRYGGEMGALADELKSAGVTLLIAPVLKDATAFYPSDILPRRWEYGTQLLAFRYELRRRNIAFGAAVPFFRDNYTHRAEPIMRAVNDYGAVPAAALCPSNKEYRDYKKRAVSEIMLILQPDALFLNDFYFPAEISQLCQAGNRNNIRTSCFCSNCLQQFSDYAGVDFSGTETTADAAGTINKHYAREWALWRSNLLTSYLENISTEVHRYNSHCQIMLNVIPLPDWESDEDRRRIFGLDYKTLSPFVDVFVLNSCSSQGNDNNNPMLQDMRELQALGEKTLPLFDVRSYLRPGEEVFLSDLQHFRGNLLVSDWGQLLNNRRFMNVFKTEL